MLRQRQALLAHAIGGRLTRRQIVQRGTALGLGAAPIGTLLEAPRRAGAQTPSPSGTVVSWTPSGQRWELA